MKGTNGLYDGRRVCVRLVKEVGGYFDVKRRFRRAMALKCLSFDGAVRYE